MRGQAKTRILRALPDLLDEWIPVVAEAEVWDDPLEPQFKVTRRIIDAGGDDTPIAWLHRDERYHEKLATPDVSITMRSGCTCLYKVSRVSIKSSESSQQTHPPSIST